MENLTKDLTLETLPNAFKQLSDEVSEIKRLLLEKSNEKPEQPEKLLSIQETADFLSPTVSSMYPKVSKGDLTIIKRSKRRYFSRTELMEYLKESHKKPDAEIEAEADDYLLNNKKKVEEKESSHNSSLHKKQVRDTKAEYAEELFYLLHKQTLSRRMAATLVGFPDQTYMVTQFIYDWIKTGKAQVIGIIKCKRSGRFVEAITTNPELFRKTSDNQLNIFE